LPKGLWKFAYWPVIWAVIFLPSIIWGDTGSMNGYLQVLSRILGIVILAWAFTLHTIAGKTLKRFGHSPESSSIWPDRLVSVGIYSCMRHPQHLSLATIPVGISLLLASPIAIILSGWGILAASLFVFAIEAPDCLKKFGMTYYKYMKTTPAFSLKPGCIAVGLNALKQ